MFKKKYTILYVLFVFMSTTQAQQDETFLRNILLARFTKLHNLIVNYKVTKELTPDLTDEEVMKKRGDRIEVINTGTIVAIKEFSILENRYLYDQHIESWDRKRRNIDFSNIDSARRRLNVFNPDRSEHLRVRERGEPRGEIRSQRNLPEGDIDIALGLRKRSQDNLLTDLNINDMSISRSDNDRVVLRDVDAGGITHEWIFDLKLECALTRYRRLVPPDNNINIEYIMEDFKNVDGIFLPFKVRSIWQGEDKKPFRTDTIEIIEYKLNDPDNTPERYRIKWPDGTRIMDTQSRMQFTVKGGHLNYGGDDDFGEIVLDAIANIEVKDPTTSAFSKEMNKREDAIDKERANLPVGDILLSTEPQKVYSQFWWAGALVVIGFVSFSIYRKRNA